MSQYQELIQGIPLLNCWRGRKWMLIIREMLLCLFGICVMFIIHHNVPSIFSCSDVNNICSCSFIEQQPIFFNACNINNNTLKKNITTVLQNVANELTTQYQCKWNDFVATGITNCNN